MDPSISFFRLLVPTKDTYKYQAFIQQRIASSQPVLVTGGSGSGKTVVVKDLLARLPLTLTVNLNFSAQTEARSVQVAVESKLFKKGKTVFGAKPK